MLRRLSSRAFAFTNARNASGVRSVISPSAAITSGHFARHLAGSPILTRRKVISALRATPGESMHATSATHAAVIAAFRPGFDRIGTMRPHSEARIVSEIDTSDKRRALDEERWG